MVRRFWAAWMRASADIVEGGVDWDGLKGEEENGLWRGNAIDGGGWADNKARVRGVVDPDPSARLIEWRLEAGRRMRDAIIMYACSLGCWLYIYIYVGEAESCVIEFN